MDYDFSYKDYERSDDIILHLFFLVSAISLFLGTVGGIWFLAEKIL